MSKPANKKIYETFEGLWRKAIKYVPILLTIFVWIKLVIAAISGIDVSWDSPAYHLPFAARLHGIYSEIELILSPSNEARFDGFPLLGEYLQGILWKVSGNVAYANLLGVFVVLLVVFAAYKLLRLKISNITLYLLCIPVVLIHATSAYVDLVASSFLVIAIIILIASFMDGKFPLKYLIFALLMLVFSSNTKYQLYPIVVVFWITTVGLYAFINKKNLIKKKKPARKFWAALIVIIVSGFLVNATYIKNFVKFENPFYPFDTTIGSIHFEGPEGIPDATVDKRIEKRFGRPMSNYQLYLASLGEVFVYNNAASERLFSIDQGGSSLRESKALKSGGYFVGNLFLWGAFISFIGIKYKDKKVLVLAGLSGAAFILVGFLPSSRLLRYWQFLPMILAIIALVVRKKYSSRESSLVFFMAILQVIIFLVLFRFNYRYFQPKENMKIQNQYTIEVSEPTCVVESVFGMYYKVYNPEFEIQVVPNASKCIYPIYVK